MYQMWMRVLFGMQEVFIILGSYTMTKEHNCTLNMKILSVNACDPLNKFDMRDKCVTWITTEPSVRQPTHTFLTHNCMFGLAQVHVMLALHILNTNNNALLVF